MTEGAHNPHLVQVLKTDERLNERHVGTLFAGETFGELALLHRQLRTATVVADLPSTILYLKTEAYDQVKGGDEHGDGSRWNRLERIGSGSRWMGEDRRR